MPEANDLCNDIEDSHWQFLITGGIDFGMSLTVFQSNMFGRTSALVDRPAYYKIPTEIVTHLHLEMPQLRVTEGGKADRVGLKLGDSIIQINDQDTTDMALQEAQKLIEISSNQLQLKVKNVDDEEETGHAEVRNIVLRTENNNKKKSESKDGSPHPNMPDSLEAQLKAMQQRLSELALIPDQIQETLMNVAKTMQKFLPPGSLIVTDPPENAVDEIDQYDDSYRFDEDKDEVELDEEDATDDELEEVAEEEEEGTAAEGGSSADGEENAEALEEKLEVEPEKPNPFQWPWSSQERNTFKRSNFQGYRSSSMIQNRIKQLNAKDLFATYQRNQANIGN